MIANTFANPHNYSFREKPLEKSKGRTGIIGSA
jgi:hypothetical protein